MYLPTCENFGEVVAPFGWDQYTCLSVLQLQAWPWIFFKRGPLKNWGRSLIPSQKIWILNGIFVNCSTAYLSTEANNVRFSIKNSINSIGSTNNYIISYNENIIEQHPDDAWEIRFYSIVLGQIIYLLALLTILVYVIYKITKLKKRSSTEIKRDLGMNTLLSKSMHKT